MPPQTNKYLTTKELADLLRIKERKVYDLASSGEIPCSRALGKLLFPRAAVEAWIARHGTDGAELATTRPNLFLGSHDPLLEWAISESRCGMAIQIDSSFDGLERFARAEGAATGLHIFTAESEEWNRPSVEARFAHDRVVLAEWAWRERGLIVAADNPWGIETIESLKRLKLVPRQAESGSQVLLDHLLAQAGLTAADFEVTDAVRSETEAALAVLEGRADAAFGLLSLARQYRLSFVPVIRERFDLLVWRHAWFEEPFQTFLAFARSDACLAKAEQLGGYDLSGLARIHFNGA